MRENGYTLKGNEAEARERLRAFWTGAGVDRPALLVRAERPDFLPRAWEGPVPEDKDKDLSDQWQVYEAQDTLERYIYLAEAMPIVNIRFGSRITLLAVLSGGDYSFHSDSGWIKPWPEVYESPLPCFDTESPTTKRLLRIFHQVTRAVGDRGAIAQPIWIDALSTLSCFRGQDQLCLDLLECPETVRNWTQAATTLLLDGYNYFYDALKKLGHKENTTWIPLLAEGTMAIVQCDFSILISPAHYEAFVLEDVVRHAESQSYPLYHIDGVANMRFFEYIHQIPGLKAVQFSACPQAPSECMEALRTIRAHGLSICFEEIAVEEALKITRALGPDGLLFDFPIFETPAEAEQALARF